MAIQNAKNLNSSQEEDLLLKVFVVGDYGTGKSVFASTFPTPGFVFDFDRGALTYRGLDFDFASYEISSKGWIEFEKDLKEVIERTKNGLYKTVIVDSCSTLTDLAMERALQLDPKRGPSGGPLWNVHYQIVRNLVEGKLRQVINLPANIVVLAHQQVVQDQETGAIISIEPLLTGQLAQRVPGYFDEVYSASVKQKQGKSVYALRTATRGLFKARSRISGKQGLLPEEIRNDYSVIAEVLKTAFKN